jgi:hypothetical protein
VPVRGAYRGRQDDARPDPAARRSNRLNALRDALRRREIYVEGADRWRDIDEGLPGGFEDKRNVHYAALRKPLDAAAFTDDLRLRMTTALDTLETGLADGTAGDCAS